MASRIPGSRARCTGARAARSSCRTRRLPGDTLSTRVRYHGIPRGGLRVGPDRTGARVARGRDGRGAGAALAAVAGGERRTGDRRVARPGVRRPAGRGERHADRGRYARATAIRPGTTSSTRRCRSRRWPWRRDATRSPRFRAPSCGGACAPVTLWTPPEDSAAAGGGRVPPRGRDGGLPERPPGAASLPGSGPRGRAARAGGRAGCVGRAVRRRAGARGPGHRARGGAGDGRPVARQRGRRSRARGRAALDGGGGVPRPGSGRGRPPTGARSLGGDAAAGRGRVPAAARRPSATRRSSAGSGATSRRTATRPPRRAPSSGRWPRRRGAARLDVRPRRSGRGERRPALGGRPRRCWRALLACSGTLPPLRGQMEVGRDGYAVFVAGGAAAGGDLYAVRDRGRRRSCRSPSAPSARCGRRSRPTA